MELESPRRLLLILNLPSHTGNSPSFGHLKMLFPGGEESRRWFGRVREHRVGG